jgi:hypothetical protein
MDVTREAATPSEEGERKDVVLNGEGNKSGPPVTQGENAVAADTVAPAETATRLFLKEFQQRIEASAADARAEMTALRRRETIVFSTYISTGILSLIIVIAGFVLIVLNLLTFAIIAEIVGLVGGTASVSFRQVGQSAMQRRGELSKREESDRNVLTAIGVTLMIPDAEGRNSAMVDLASRLAEMVGPRPSGTHPGSSRNRQAGRKASGGSGLS